MPAADTGATKELRLALVCYGGSSLAIYMHGMTKEVHRLVKASRMLEPDVVTAAGGSASELVYAELIHTVAERDPEHVRTRVVVDVIAGTSAGGINGIYLAKALAHNRSQEALRDLWFERGDIAGLLAAPRGLPKLLRYVIVAVGILFGHSPLRGDGMAQWLYKALEGMDEAGSTPESLATLMPGDHLLELFVTVTDFHGYDRQVPTADPTLVHDNRHRDVLVFRYRDGDDDNFARQSNGALAFAARTTSSFPGVFPPMSLERFADYLAGTGADLSGLDRRFFRLYELAGARPADKWFVDGGVLDNKPFGYAIDAIRRRPADLEVDRRLLYLEPAPGQPPEPSDKRPKPEAAPSPVAALIGAVSGIPRSEPILDDLLEVARLNERVERIREIVATSFDQIAALVEAALGQSLSVPLDPDSPQLQAWGQAVHRLALEKSGFSYATYIRLKISSVVDRYAETACKVCDYPSDSNQAMLVLAILRCWADAEGLFDKPDETLVSEHQTKFLQDFDLGYGQRRLRFVIAGLSSWYGKTTEPGYPSRKDLDAGKDRLYAAIETLRDAMSSAELDPSLVTAIKNAFAPERLAAVLSEHSLDATRFVVDRRQELDGLASGLRAHLDQTLADFTPTLYRDLYELSNGWDADRRRDLLVRYLGFPLWDVLLFPVQALSDVGEADHVEVVRMSPLDADLLQPRPGELKVKGVALSHFGAFFSRPDRENDYLWGRLDGAARLVGLLVGSEADPIFEEWCKKAFRAILDEEEQQRALDHVGPLVEHLRSQV